MLGLHHVRDAALARLAVDPDDGLVRPADVGRIDRQVGNAPLRVFAAVVALGVEEDDAEDLLEAVELGFLLDLAEVVVYSALNREESRGGHMRDDFPNRDDEKYMQHTMAYLTGDPTSPDPEDHISLGWKPVVFTKNEAGELRYPPMERKY